MSMTSEQTNAFKAGSGSLDVNILHLLCIGALLAFLFYGPRGRCRMSGPAGVTPKCGTRPGAFCRPHRAAVACVYLDVCQLTRL